MCEASNWSKIHSYICIACYLLCVFFDVHLHSVDCATTKGKSHSHYDALVYENVPTQNQNYLLVRTSRSIKNSYLCQNDTTLVSNSSFTNYTNQLIETFVSSVNESNARLKNLSDTAGVITFEKFLKSIGLGSVHSHDDHDDHDHGDDSDHKSAPKGPKPTRHKENKCLSAEQYYDRLGIHKSCPLQKKQFKEICPSLLYQISKRSCEEEKEDPLDKRKDLKSMGAVWGCSIAAVIVISLVGLAAVALIPLMKKGFYDILVQFLIAVGVGTLIGDAILHLIPHALVQHDHSHEGTGNDKEMQQTVWKSMMALVGIHMFFLTERLTTMIQSYRVRKRIRRRRTRLLDTPTSKNGADEGTVAIIQSDSHYINGDKANKIFSKLHSSQAGHTSSGPQTDGATPLNDSGFDLGKLVATDHGSHAHNSQPRSECNVVAEEANRLMHQTPVHHCHSHDFSSIKAIAWTVIMGDGLHNFCDGVAIGAAFVDDLRGGLSTSVAVIWHELPHEIGDFAVLLKAGMSVKMAVFYNVLSSIFCFAGMVIGITIGGMQNVTPWVFMLATGMFIYIALVDMLPNLTCDQVDENGQPTVDSTKSHRKLVFFVQNLGMLCGYAVMVLIALYEDKILS